MNILIKKMEHIQTSFTNFDFIPAVLLRFYLAPIFWMAGTQKLSHFSDTVEWFGNPDWGLGLPIPWVMAFLATGTELVGSIFLVLGFATRWISIPLTITMIVAALTVHLENGWLAIATGSGLFATERSSAAIDRLHKAKEILQTHGNYDWLTEYGNLVVLNNGIEFSATYMIMLFALIVIGGGRFFSVDYWIAKQFPARV